VIDLFQRQFQLGRGEPTEDKILKITRALDRHGLASPEAIPLWAAFLSVQPADAGLLLNLARRRVRQKTAGRGDRSSGMTRWRTPPSIA
jgi:hypothetical protein